MRRLLLVAALILVVAGCSSSPSASDTPSPTQPTAATTTSNPTPAAPSSATPDANCLDGRYGLIRFVGVGAKGTYGTGEGGDAQSPLTMGPT
jgi:hypothetical protein